MTRTEEQAWHKKGRAYSDTFLDKVRVRQVLKKRKKAEESGTAVKLTKRQQFLDSYVDRLSQLESTCARLKRFPIFLSSNHTALVRRGSHTHEKYFQDDQIDEMLKYDKASDFATTPADKKIFKNLAKTSLALQRRRWKKDINSDIHKCEIQMGVLYEALDKLVWQIYKKIK